MQIEERIAAGTSITSAALSFICQFCGKTMSLEISHAFVAYIQLAFKTFGRELGSSLYAEGESCAIIKGLSKALVSGLVYPRVVAG